MIEQQMIEDVAKRHGLDPKVVVALVGVESGGNEFAWNPEPPYRYYWDVRRNRPFRTPTPEELRSEKPPLDFPAFAGDPDQEWWGQAASWGVCQVMGAVARELGFKGPYLTELVRPELSLEYGCRVLARNLEWAKGDLASALAAYNGGRVGNAPGTVPLRNQAYADKVLARVKG